MQRRRTLRGEELQDFLKSINRLGYPARSPLVAWQDTNESQESFGYFAKDDSQKFCNSDTSQIPPDWESSFAIG